MANLIDQNGNFNVIEKLLEGDGKFLALRGKLSKLDIIQQYYDMVLDSSPDFLTEVSVWQSPEHMRLKQLTQTNYQQYFDLLPEMLKVQFNEALEMSGNDTFLDHLFRFFANNFKIGKLVLSPKRYKAIFAKLSINIKKNSNEFGSEWFKYTDLENFVGYNLVNPLTTEGKAEIVKNWGKGYVDRGTGEKKYYKEFYSSLIKRFKQGVSILSLRKLSVIEYVSLIQPWMTDGSSRGERLIMNVNGKDVKSNGKKQVLALKFTPEQIKGKVMQFNRGSETYSVSEKIEPGLKLRCIISAPFEQQIRLGYVEYCLGSLFKHAFPDVFFLQSQSRQLTIQDELCDLSKNRAKSFVFFPLDASSFDQFVSKTEVTSVFLSLREVLSEYKSYLHDEVFTMLDLGLHAWFNSDIVVDRKLNMGKWEHGVPSGVRWTALMDSMINAARFDVCRKYVGRSMLVEKAIFQGDDMMLALRRLSDTLKILDFYEEHNIPIHPAKNFLSYTYFEFLRKIYQGGNQFAYPNRTITKFCFRLPENAGARDSRSIMQERFTGVFRTCSRYNATHVIIPKVAKIIQKLFGNLTSESINELIHSPSILGGLAFIPKANMYSNKTKRILMNFTYSTVEEPRVKLKVSGSYRALSDKLNIEPKLLQQSLIKSLNPSPSRNFGQTVTHSAFKYNPILSINLKLNLSRGVPGKWRPWMPKNEFLSPLLPDLLNNIIVNEDWVTARSITNDRILPSFDHFVTKMDPRLFASWLNSTIELPTFYYNNLNDMQRKHLSDVVYGNYLLRYLAIHDR